MVEGITRRTRRLPPSHYLFKIDAFSLLVEAKVDKYKSNVFEPGGHQWKLVLYPTGNKKGNGSGYISLCLELQKTGNLSLDWEVNVDFKLLVFDQIRDQYLVIKAEHRFTSFATSWGYSQFKQLKDVYEFSNGYMVKDSLIVEAEFILISKVD